MGLALFKFNNNFLRQGRQNLKMSCSVINPPFWLLPWGNDQSEFHAEFHANNLNTFEKVNGNVRTDACTDRKFQILNLERTAKP